MPYTMRLIVPTLCCMTHICFANCDPQQFRDPCTIPLHITKPTHVQSSLVYCGHAYGYITKAQYDILTRYQQDDITMNIKLNDRYIDGPCVPAGR
jgi:hypothetical protein